VIPDNFTCDRTEMKNLVERLFGLGKPQRDEDMTARKEKTLASVNESETTADKPPRVNRTIGLTEARLRARNVQSWKTSTRGWSDLFGRFTTFGSRNR
jgi:hypothetical protein